MDRCLKVLRASSLILVAILSSLTVVPSCSAEQRQSLNASNTDQSKEQRIGLVLNFSGSWVLQLGQNKVPVISNGASVYEGARPLRLSKEGTLTVACINNTRAICPGNHKIGEPFRLRQQEDVDDWWTQLVPFLTNYGSWIFPVARSVDHDVMLNDAIVCEPLVQAGSGVMDISDVVSNVDDGAYEFQLEPFPASVDGSKKIIKLTFVKTSGPVTGTVITEERLMGAYLFRLIGVAPETKKHVDFSTNRWHKLDTLKVAPESKKHVDFSSVEPALIEIVDKERYEQHKLALQSVLRKTEKWGAPQSGNSRAELIRALIVALSRSPVNSVPTELSKPGLK